MEAQKNKRRGGVRDETDVNIGLTRVELISNFVAIEKRTKVYYNHQFPYVFKQYKAQDRTIMPLIWRKVKHIIRKHIDGWQQELPLF